MVAGRIHAIGALAAALATLLAPRRRAPGTGIMSAGTRIMAVVVVIARRILELRRRLSLLLEDWLYKLLGFVPENANFQSLRHALGELLAGLQHHVPSSVRSRGAHVVHFIRELEEGSTHCHVDKTVEGALVERARMTSHKVELHDVAEHSPIPCEPDLGEALVVELETVDHLLREKHLALLDNDLCRHVPLHADGRRILVLGLDALFQKLVVAA
mmetsp:Transcript_44035/g.93724  ORF Transcript_44035/g.93724 Transcript_44035/m.93724 type:complete len:215 (-) Transcript_44035:587-1231(-)